MLIRMTAPSESASDGVSASHISLLCTGKRWNDIAGDGKGRRQTPHVGEGDFSRLRGRCELVLHPPVWFGFLSASRHIRPVKPCAKTAVCITCENTADSAYVAVPASLKTQ